MSGSVCREVAKAKFFKPSVLNMDFSCGPATRRNSFAVRLNDVKIGPSPCVFPFVFFFFCNVISEVCLYFLCKCVFLY